MHVAVLSDLKKILIGNNSHKYNKHNKQIQIYIYIYMIAEPELETETQVICPEVLVGDANYEITSGYISIFFHNVMSIIPQFTIFLI